jgi:hypothetical protein
MPIAQKEDAANLWFNHSFLIGFSQSRNQDETSNHHHQFKCQVASHEISCPPGESVYFAMTPICKPEEEGVEFEVSFTNPSNR